MEIVPVNGKDTQKITVELRNEKQVGKCIVMASIAAIDSDMGWYYLSCKVCVKKVLTVPNDIEDGEEDNVDGHNYYCLKCKDNHPQLLPRYKLHLVVLGSTNNTKFLLFDNLVLQLLHKPCVELTGPITDEESQNTMEGTFSALSDAPEGSLMLHGGSSQHAESTELTPPKRVRTPVINLEDVFDQTSVTRGACNIKIKKEKIEKVAKKCVWGIYE
ncbi:hypothetical protein Rs2_10030 [Raphanus sativus]|nr:hypothetical protein Rs2_10030 [Raphanus sativus]